MLEGLALVAIGAAGGCTIPFCAMAVRHYWWEGQATSNGGRSSRRRASRGIPSLRRGNQGFSKLPCAAPEDSCLPTPQPRSRTLHDVCEDEVHAEVLASDIPNSEVGLCDTLDDAETGSAAVEEDFEVDDEIGPDDSVSMAWIAQQPTCAAAIHPVTSVRPQLNLSTLACEANGHSQREHVEQQEDLEARLEAQLAAQLQKQPARRQDIGRDTQLQAEYASMSDRELGATCTRRAQGALCAPGIVASSVRPLLRPSKLQHRVLQSPGCPKPGGRLADLLGGGRTCRFSSVMSLPKDG